MANVVKHIYQFKRGTSQNWIDKNPILLQGEPGYETDTGKLKIGDGFTPYGALPYINEGAIFNTDTRDQFPKVGSENTIYKAQDETALYQWNSKTESYELLSAGEQLIDELVKDVDEVRQDLAAIEALLSGTIVLYGGTATDNLGGSENA